MDEAADDVGHPLRALGVRGHPVSEWGVLPPFYDRAGLPLSDVFEWSRLFERDDYRRVARTVVTSGVGPPVEVQVVTIWTGLDMCLRLAGDGPPLIFETMTARSDSRDMSSVRYASEDQALAGHADMVTAVRATLDAPTVVDDVLPPPTVARRDAARPPSTARSAPKVPGTGDANPAGADRAEGEKEAAVRTPYFGEPWDAPALRFARQVATPVGVPCVKCGEAVAEGDRGVIRGAMTRAADGLPDFVARPLHLECDLRVTLGGPRRPTVDGYDEALLVAAPPDRSARQHGRDLLDMINRSRETRGLGPL